MSNTMHVFSFLEKPPGELPPVCILFGAEPFLTRLARERLVQTVMQPDDELAYSRRSGDETDWRNVHDELSTVSLFGGGQRLVVISGADDFVSKHRAALEEYVAKPSANGMLVLEVETWATNTRLYKVVDQRGVVIDCRAPIVPRSKDRPDVGVICKWLVAWAQQQHGVKLERGAAEALVELVGPEFGLLDQGLAKMALLLRPNEKATPAQVQAIVGGWRSQSIWDLTDAAAEGKTAESLQQLDRLLFAGEAPLALLAQMSFTLRRLAAATRIYELAERRGERKSLATALKEAGISTWKPGGLEMGERQLVQLGRRRANQLYEWLVEADLALKGSHSSDERGRFILEQLLFRMTRKTSPPTAQDGKPTPAATANRTTSPRPRTRN